jgi:hypothetical protein
MSFLTETAEGLMNLSAEEKATVNAAFPTMTEDVAEINAHQDQLRASYALLVKAAPVVDRLLDDWKTLGPIMHDVLDGSGSMFTLGGAITSGKDIQATLATNPWLVGEVQKHYAQLAPLITKLSADLPKIMPALQIIAKHAGAVASVA